MLRKLGKLLAQGLVTVLPLIVTIYVLFWLGRKAEGVFGGPLHHVLGRYYIPGMGLVVGFIVVIVAGALAKHLVTLRMLAWSDSVVRKIPLAKTVYGSVKDLLSLFSGGKKAFSRVVLVKIPGLEHRTLGMVTREDFSEVSGFREGLAAVYVPFSYAIGGFTIIAPAADLEPVGLSVEEALRFAVTAGISTKAQPTSDTVDAGISEKVPA